MINKIIISIILACVLFTQGCSIAINHRNSPLVVDNGCNTWPVVVDSIIASGFVFTAVMANQYRDWDIQPEYNRQPIMILNLIGATVLGMSAFMGYGEAHECRTRRTDEH